MDNNQKGKVSTLNWSHAGGITKFQAILITKGERRETNHAWGSEMQSRVHEWTKDVAKHNWEKREMFRTRNERPPCVLPRAYTRQRHPPVIIEKESGELTEVMASYRKELSWVNKSDSRIFLLQEELRNIFLGSIWSTFQGCWKPSERCDATDKSCPWPTDSGTLSSPAWVRTPHLQACQSSWRGHQESPEIWWRHQHQKWIGIRGLTGGHLERTETERVLVRMGPQRERKGWKDRIWEALTGRGGMWPSPVKAH